MVELSDTNKSNTNISYKRYFAFVGLKFMGQAVMNPLLLHPAFLMAPLLFFLVTVSWLQIILIIKFNKYPWICSLGFLGTFIIDFYVSWKLLFTSSSTEWVLLYTLIGLIVFVIVYVPYLVKGDN